MFSLYRIRDIVTATLKIKTIVITKKQPIRYSFNKLYKLEDILI